MEINGWREKLKKLLRYKFNSHQNEQSEGVDMRKKIRMFFDQFGIKRIYRFTFVTILLTSLLTGTVFYFFFLTVTKGINVTVTNKIEQPATPARDPFETEEDAAKPVGAATPEPETSESCEVAIMSLQGPLVPISLLIRRYSPRMMNRRLRKRFVGRSKKPIRTIMSTLLWWKWIRPVATRWQLRRSSDVSSAQRSRSWPMSGPRVHPRPTGQSPAPTVFLRQPFRISGVLECTFHTSIMWRRTIKRV